MINKRMISGSMIKIDSMKVGSSFISSPVGRAAYNPFGSNDGSVAGWSGAGGSQTSQYKRQEGERCAIPLIQFHFHGLRKILSSLSCLCCLRRVCGVNNSPGFHARISKNLFSRGKGGRDIYSICRMSNQLKSLQASHLNL